MKASVRTTTNTPGRSSKNVEELLDRGVEEPTAKRFLKVMARSDLATEKPQHQRTECTEEP